MTIAAKESHSPRLSGRIYSLLWLFGVAGAAVSYLELQEKQLLGITDVFAFALGFATFGQQVAVYMDIHFIEDKPVEARRDYADWIDHPIERILRVLILACLLFGVGKIADALLPVVERVQCPGVREWLVEFIHPPLGQGSASRALFVKGSLGVFLFLVLWNIGALIYRIKLARSSLGDSVSPRWLAITVRIICFVIISGIALVYWLAVYLDSTYTGHIAELLIFSYLICVFLAVFLWRNPDALETMLTYITHRNSKGGG